MPERAPARIVFWPFGLFGSPGTETGAGELCDGLLARLAEYESDPACRLHPVAAAARVEIRPFGEMEDYAGWRATIRRRFERSLGRGELPVFVGGNHLTALPVYEAYSAMRGRTCVVSLDAHLDAYDLPGARETLHHGNFLLHLRRGPGLSIVNVGHRDLVLDPRRAGEFFDRLYPAEALDGGGLEAALRDLARHLRGFERVHVDLDLDVLDPAALRAVASPAPGGLSTRELVRVLGALLSPKLSGITISEYDASADPDGAGKRLVLWLLEWILLRRIELSVPRTAPRRRRPRA